MSEPLIGFLYLTEVPHPDWPGHFPEELSEGIPRTAQLPQLAVAGLPFAPFAWAMLRKARAEGTYQRGEASPYPEDAYFEVEPERVDEDNEDGFVRTATCSCGHAGCGSNSARVTRGERNGVPGLSFTDWHTREDPERHLPLPPIFVPLAAWPELTRREQDRWSGGRLRSLLTIGTEAPRVTQAAVARWEANRPRMVAAARQAAAGLADPWGRTLGLREWHAQHEKDSKARHLAMLEEQRYRRSPAGVLARYEEKMRECDLDEAFARQGILTVGGVKGLDDLEVAPAEPDPQLVAQLLKRVEERRAYAQREYEEELLPPRERRLARRARAREAKAAWLAILGDERFFGRRR